MIAMENALSIVVGRRFMARKLKPIVYHWKYYHTNKKAFCIGPDVCSVSQLKVYLSWKSRSSVGVPQLEGSVLLRGIAFNLCVILAIDVVSLWSFSWIYMLRADNKLARNVCHRNLTVGWKSRHPSISSGTRFRKVYCGPVASIGGRPQWYQSYSVKVTLTSNWGPSTEEPGADPGLWNRRGVEWKYILNWVKF
jgi:hypothetical protein